MKKLVAGALMASMLIAFVGCTVTDKGPNISANNLSARMLINKHSLGLKKLDEDEEEAINADLADFSINLMKETLKSSDEGTNILISPTSIICALGMNGNGADGNTLKQFEDVIVGGKSIDELNSLMAGRIPGDEQFSLANSIWISDDSTTKSSIKKDFLSLNKYVYDADVMLAPFDESTVEDVNTWVDYKTNGMIPSVINDIDPLEVMLFVNAACFDAAWEESYPKSKVSESKEFTNYLGETEEVTMLYSKEDLYFEIDGATGFGKYYDGEKYLFIGLVPNEGVDIDLVVERMTGELWMRMYDTSMSDMPVRVAMPEFSFNYDAELSKTLATMGMPNAFGINADFSNMAPGLDLVISRIIHKTHIKVDRTGATAVAATASADAKNSYVESREVQLDRPFIFAIVDADTGLPIFMGTVNTVTGEK